MFLSHPIILCLIFQLTIFVSTESTLRENESELLPRPPNCGRQAESKIIGDGNKTHAAFPWMALLIIDFPPSEYDQAEKGLQCDGFFISKRYVLASVHCVSDFDNGLVRLARWRITNNPDCDSGGYDEKECSTFIDIPIQTIMWERNTYLTYPTLIRLRQEVIFNDFIQPICLPTSNELKTKSFVGKYLTGLRARGGEFFNDIQKVQVNHVYKTIKIPVFDLYFCDREFRVLFGDPSDLWSSKDQLCVAFDRNNDSDNDQQWPFIMYEQQEWYAVGIYYYGVDSYDRREHSALYTRTARHIDWITDNMEP